MKKQIDLYKENTATKINEEKELLKVLKDYKGRYTEFEKATKKSKINFKQFEKEARMLETKRKELEKQKDKEEKKYG